MVALPADPRRIASAFGGVVLAHSADGSLASYDADGHRFSLSIEPSSRYRYALDVESRRQEVPASLASVLGDRGFEKWTELEVLAKLFDVPVHILLRRYVTLGPTGFSRAYPAEVVRCDTDSHYIAVGRVPSPP